MVMAAAAAAAALGVVSIDTSKLRLRRQCHILAVATSRPRVLASPAGSQQLVRAHCVKASVSTPPQVPVIPKQCVSVVLLAGGVGKRMGADMPKQYLPLLGQPIALYSFHTFAKMTAVKEIVVVCDPSYNDLFQEAAQSIGVAVKFALPGKERQDSVLSGLQQISHDSKLACIHDSARPLVLLQDIQKVLKDAWVHGAAVLGVRVKATIKEAGADQFVERTLDRRTLWEMQTPEAIEPGLLRKGFELVQREKLEVTDDVSIVEHLKHPVFITEGSYTNLKVTTPDDLLVAERILHSTPLYTPASMIFKPVLQILMENMDLLSRISHAHTQEIKMQCERTQVAP